MGGPGNQAPVGPTPVTSSALPSPAVRVVWIVAIILLVVGLGAWATTCTGERPRPTGDTIPGGDAVTTTVPATATTLAG
jgi:hypothetical protein